MNDKLTDLVADVASAYFSHNHLRIDEVPGFLAGLQSAFADLDSSAPVETDKPKPAVKLRRKKTVHPHHLVSLIDAKRYKMLRRHLTVKGITPDEYRTRVGLPRDYPMVSGAKRRARPIVADHGEALVPRRPHRPGPAPCGTCHRRWGEPRRRACCCRRSRADGRDHAGVGGEDRDPGGDGHVDEVKTQD